MLDLPIQALYFLGFFWGLIGLGLLISRLFVVERLRLLNGGVESRGLRAGRRITDALIYGLWSFAMFWIVTAVVRTVLGAT